MLNIKIKKRIFCRWHHLKYIICVLFFLCGLQACSTGKDQDQNSDIPMVPQYPHTRVDEHAGQRVGGLIGILMRSHKHLVDRLMQKGVQVVREGDDIRIIIPSDVIFVRGSANLKPIQMPVLADVAHLLQAFEKVDVLVMGYTDNQGDWQHNLALSRTQAQTVEDVLARYNVNARILYVMGYGSQYPIADNNTVRGQYQNRRIEIRFRKLEHDVLV